MFGWYFYTTAANYRGPYPEKDEAIEAGRSILPADMDFYVMEGRKTAFVFPSADTLLDTFRAQNAHLGTEAEPFSETPTIPDMQKQNLEIAVRDAFSAWIEGNGIGFNVAAFEVIRKKQLIPAAVEPQPEE